MSRTSLVLAALAVLIAAPGCAKKTSDLQVIISNPIADGSVVLKNRSGELKQGTNDLVVEFVGNGGKLISVQKATLSGSMPVPGGTPMGTAVTLQPSDEPGRFTAKPKLDMRGDWQFTVDFVLPSGPGQSFFSLTVK
ncbi:MAG TPA: FixH family protein [Acidobacteriota bacterium]|jgi:hypothetical protein